jgi:cation:H+ antiporter
VIGLTIVAFGTSAPEFAVTVSAALEGQGDISVGNVVGSNIFNLGFVLGGVAAIRAIATTPTLVKRDGAVLVGTTLMLLFFIRDLTLSRPEGLILITMLVIYLGYLLWQRESLEEMAEIEEATWRDGFILVVGLVAIIAGGHFLVEHASSLALRFGVSTWVIGVTIVAAGTSAPELVISLMAVMRGRHGISIGNLIGSDIFNLQGVLGVAALINPMQVAPEAISSVSILIVMVCVVVFFMRTGWAVVRWEGALLIVVNLIRWVRDFS